MINNEVRSNIQKYGQEHLLKYYDTLSTKERSIYDEQLNNLNFGYLDINRENKNEKKETHYEPIQALRKDDINKDREQFEKIGIVLRKKHKH